MLFKNNIYFFFVLFFVIGTGNWGARPHVMFFGYSDTEQTNPHLCYGDHSTTSAGNVMRLDGLSKNVDIYGTFTAPTVNAVTANFGHDGILKINSRPTTHGFETVGLQTTIDNKTNSYSIDNYGGQSRHLLALQPEGNVER